MAYTEDMPIALSASTSDVHRDDGRALERRAARPSLYDLPIDVAAFVEYYEKYGVTLGEYRMMVGVLPPDKRPEFDRHAKAWKLTPQKPYEDVIEAYERELARDLGDDTDE